MGKRPESKAGKRPDRTENAAAPMPSREQIRQFIADSPGRVGKREIARAFKLGPEHRNALRGVLKSLAGAGDAAPAGHKRFRAPGRLPEAMVVRVTGTDPDGDAIARPVAWEGDGPTPVVYMAREPSGRAALAPGATVLARLKPLGPGKYEGRTLKRLDDSVLRVLGAFRRDGDGGRLVPTDRRQKAEWAIPPGETLGAETDDIVLAEPLPRGTLDLDLPERKVTIGADGKVAAITPRPRLDSHRLIEEFMVLANVAAAEETERLKRPCIFRVHAPPSPEKLENLRDFLSTLGIELKPAGELRPADLDAVLQRVAGLDTALQVNEVVLRSQSQAAYDVENIGHFGLNLRAYAHFTSPIRRYADLVVHRTLIAALKLGVGGLEAGAEEGLADVAEAVTATERRATLAERDANDRYLAAFMSDQTGTEFAARISGVTRFGLFVTLAQNGASGLLPVSSLPDDFWMHDETSHALIGRRTRAQYRLTDTIDVRLVEANALTGSLVFAPARGIARPERTHPARTGRQPRR